MSVINKPSSQRLKRQETWASKPLYFALMENMGDPAIDSSSFLAARLRETRQCPSQLPASIEQLDEWLLLHNLAIGRQYMEYLEAREAGQPRRYFSTRAHALYFLRAVAPTKMVDGAWLYGLTRHWDDPRLTSLINTYLEELGDGAEAMNHVALYRQLLRVNECEDWKQLEDPFFTQGAVQLALAANTEHFLPEVIGFNLGYEQLPLHLLITAYELKELNIDPYYFTLHVTIDNAHTGHAKAAIEAVKEGLPLFGDPQTYMERVMAGVRLNEAGWGTEALIRHFDLQAEMVRILQSKALVGQFMHSNRCVMSGKSINEWLSDADQVAQLLHEMEKNGWIKRHQNPAQSQFWKVIAGEKAAMFGVFSAYERQVIYDWIAGDAIESMPRLERLGAPWRVREKQLAKADDQNADHDHHANVYELRSGRRLSEARTGSDFYQDQMAFERHLLSMEDERKRMDFLVDWLSPAKHFTPLGLHATRYFKAGLALPLGLELH